MTLFEMYSYSGRRIRLTQTQWTHVIFFHPEIVGEETRIKEALENPDTVVSGAAEDTEVYYRIF